MDQHLRKIATAILVLKKVETKKIGKIINPQFQKNAEYRTSGT